MTGTEFNIFCEPEFIRLYSVLAISVTNSQHPFNESKIEFARVDCLANMEQLKS